MGSIIGMLVGRRIFGTIIGEKAARVIAYVGLVLAILLLLGTAKCVYDRSVISKHEAEQRAATAEADREADNQAAVERQADQARIVQEETQLRKVEENAKSPTDRRLARHRCLRLQQQARSAGREPPSCT